LSSGQKFPRRELIHDVWLVEEVFLDQRTDLACPNLTEPLRPEFLRHEERVADGVVPIQLLRELLV
jgi:hypothetical protein